MIGAFFNCGKQKVSISMPGPATPRWMPVYKDNVIAQVCESVWAPHAESVLETMQEHYPSWSPVARRNISGGEAIAATLVVSPVYDPAEKPRTSTSLIPIWKGYHHVLWKTGSQKQQFALWVIAPEDLTNCSDPRGMWWPCMRWPDRSRSQQPYGSSD